MMPEPNSVEEFVQLVRQSGMVDEPKLADYLAHRAAAGDLPADARLVASDMIRDGIITRFQSEQFLQGRWSGFVIGKYKLLERVGVGGMAQVFLCEHVQLRKRFAVKVLPPSKADQPAALGRFFREARAASTIEHPNVVRTHDVDNDGTFHFIVMDYVEGPNLLEVVRKFGPMDLGRAASYVRQVAEGLDHAFRNGIIHRDVKPGNILIDRTGHARLLDLGLARFYNDHTDQLTIKYDDKIVLGTADYIAPEQVANSHAVDIRADIYALGSTLYYLLAGHPPFPTGSVSQKLLWHRTKEPTPIREVRPEVPEPLAAVLAKMMAKEPKSRYQTPAQVSTAIAEFVPVVVPLPNPEEMPRLSPAATEQPDPLAPSGHDHPTQAGRDSATTEAQPPGEIPTQLPVPAVIPQRLQIDIETPPPAIPTPSPESPRGALKAVEQPVQPVADPPSVPKPIPWALIVGVGVAAIAVIAIIALL
jgi:eukaryotic-like serine/threonine-protein kinase